MSTDEVNRANQRRGRRGPNQVSLEDADTVLKMQASGATYDAICDRFGYGKKAVRGLIKRCGGKQRSVGGIPMPVNHSYFSAIDLEAKAYWLGFLAADGCVSGNTISLCLNANDAHQVEKFRDAIESGHKIATYPVGGKNGAGSFSTSIRVHSRQMASDLQRLGVVPRKSLVAIPWAGPAEYMTHYWRGIIDGDGWIYRAQDCWSLGLIGSQAIVNAFREYASKVTRFRTVPKPKKRVWTIQIGGIPAVDLLEHLYRGATIALARKAAMAEQAVAEMPSPRMHLFDWSTVTKEQLLEAKARLGSWPLVAVELGASLNSLMIIKRTRFGIVKFRHRTSKKSAI